MNAVSAQRGFTLVEVQVALLVTALILGLAYSGLYLAGRSWHTAEISAARNDELRATAQLLRRLLGEAVPLLWNQRGTPAQLIFAGNDRHLRLVSALPAHQGRGGLHLLLLEVREQALQVGHLEATPALAPFTTSVARRAHWITLIEDVQSLTIDYYGTPGNDDPEPGWYRHWQEAARLPKLVRMRLESTRTGESWPELVLPVRAETNPGPFHLNLHAQEDAAS